MKATHPDCPRRLRDEAILLNKTAKPDWTARRSNKMRERFDSFDIEHIDLASLTAPVQPMPRHSLGTSAAY